MATPYAQSYAKLEKKIDFLCYLERKNVAIVFELSGFIFWELGLGIGNKEEGVLRRTLIYAFL